MNFLDQLTKIPLTKKLVLVGLVVILIGGGYWYLYYQPLMDELSALQSQQVQLQQEKKDAQQRKATYDRDRRKRDELKKNFANQLRALPPVAEMSSFLNNLNAQAELVGLEIRSVKPLEEEPADYYARIPVQLKLRGGFQQLAKFFYLVGSLDRIINIEDISLSLDKIEESGAILNAEVLATTFRSITAGEKSGGAAGGRPKRRR